VTERKHLLLYDGDCAFCTRCAAWALRGERAAAFEAQPYQIADIDEVLRANCALAAHVLTAEGKILRGGRAVTFLLVNARGLQWARILWVPPFSWLSELGYRLVALIRSYL
jgi:predicted DCC family thiol-disulfide oxidoreductase YuxK